MHGAERAQNRVVPVQRLEVGQVDGGLSLLPQAVKFSVAHYAHDLDGTDLGISGSELPSNRIAVTEVVAHECLVDDSDFRSRFRIAISDTAPQHQRHTHRSEEARSNGGEGGEDALLFF